MTRLENFKWLIATITAVSKTIVSNNNIHTQSVSQFHFGFERLIEKFYQYSNKVDFTGDRNIKVLFHKCSYKSFVMQQISSLKQDFAHTRFNMPWSMAANPVVIFWYTFVNHVALCARTHNYWCNPIKKSHRVRTQM